MTAFFEATDTAHLALIVRPLRSHLDLATVAAQVERDVLNHYTRRYPYMADYTNNFYTGRGFHKGGGKFICLEGINPDASLVTDAGLVIAMRDVIASVIVWRLSKYAENMTLQGSGTAVGVTKQFRGDALLEFPPNSWDGRLSQWDLRAPIVSI